MLTDAFGCSAPGTREALATVAELATVVRPTVRFSGLVAADANHRVLECAVAARAKFLVTGDKRHLLPLKTFRGIRVVSPRAFLDALR